MMLKKVSLNEAFELISKGKKTEAQEVLDILIKRNAKNFQALHTRGLLHMEKHENKEAQQLIEESIKLYPYDPEYWSNYGLLLFELGKTQESLDAFKRSIDLNPYNPINIKNIASAYEKINLPQFAMQKVEQGLRVAPTYSLLLYIKAQLLRKMKNRSEAKELFISLLSSNLPSKEYTQCLYELGSISQEEGNFKQAWEYVLKANSFTNKNIKEDKYYWKLLRDYQQKFLRKKPKSFPLKHPPIVFQIGFPESGENELEVLFSKETCVDVLSDTQMLLDTLNDYLLFFEKDQTHSLQYKLQSNYFYRVKKEVPAYSYDTLLIDKQSFTMSFIEFVRWLFPKAKLVLTLRHPCDSIFSSLSKQSKNKITLENFHSLENTAKLYHRIFSLLEKQSMEEIYFLKYEDLILDTKKETKKLYSFLELPYEKELKLDRLTHTIGQWEPYKKQFQPIMKYLEPYMEKFGYKPI